MLHHISIAVENPPHVADVLAELWQTRAMPFPLYPDCYIVFPGDQHGTAIEVYPLGQELIPGNPTLPDLKPTATATPSRYSATHAAVSVPLSVEQIQQIADREGWYSHYGDRASFFQVVEFWIENSVLLELLTPEMTQQYVAFATAENWERLILQR